MTHPYSIPAGQPPAPLSRRALGLRIFAFALVLLGLSVFAWGLKYKLSLYDPPHAISHAMPAAKLLPGPKHTGTAVMGLRRAELPSVPFAFTTLALVFFTLMGPRLWDESSQRRRGDPVPLLAPQFSGGRALFSRPPPFSL